MTLFYCLNQISCQICLRCIFHVSAQNRNATKSREANSAIVLGGPGPYGCSIWVHGATDVVGVFVGHHGTSNVLRWLRDDNRHVCILRHHAAGTYDIFSVAGAGDS